VTRNTIAVGIAVGLASTVAAGVAGAASSYGAGPTSAAINTHTTKNALIAVPGTGFAIADHCNVNVDGTTSQLTVRAPKGVHYQVHGTANIATTAYADVRLGSTPITSGPVSAHAAGSGFHLTAETLGGYGAATAASANGTLTVTASSVRFTLTYAQSARDSDCKLNTAVSHGVRN
jgi:hypothetical protein